MEARYELLQKQGEQPLQVRPLGNSEEITGSSRPDGSGILSVDQLVAKSMQRSMITGFAAFWDQPNTTGSDIALSPGMHAMMTFGRHTLLRDLMQGAWRLRGLEKGQRIQLAIAAADEPLLMQVLQQAGVTIDQPFSLRHALQYAFIHEVQRLADHNLRAVRHQLGAIPLKEAFSQLLNTNANQAIKDFSLYKPLVTTQMLQEPADIYGKLRAQISVEEYLAQCVEQLSSLQAVSSLRSSTEFQAEWDAIIEQMLPHITASVWMEEHYQREVSVEQEVEREQELQKETDQDISEEWITPHWIPQRRWPEEQLFSDQLYQPNPSQHNVAMMERTFLEHVLLFLPTKQRAYAGYRLQRIFKELQNK